MKIIRVILILIGLYAIWVAIGFTSFLFNFSGGSSLNGFETYRFETKKHHLENLIDTVFFDSQTINNCIPQKWIHLDDWEKRGFDFPDTRIFYFPSSPEEMYYVSFLGDSTYWNQCTYAEISIRAVGGKNGWKHAKSINEKNKNRIEKRFTKEIISVITAKIKNKR